MTKNQRLKRKNFLTQSGDKYKLSYFTSIAELIFQEVNVKYINHNQNEERSDKSSGQIVSKTSAC